MASEDTVPLERRDIKNLKSIATNAATGDLNVAQLKILSVFFAQWAGTRPGYVDYKFIRKNVEKLGKITLSEIILPEKEKGCISGTYGQLIDKSRGILFFVLRNLQDKVFF